MVVRFIPGRSRSILTIVLLLAALISGSLVSEHMQGEFHLVAVALCMLPLQAAALVWALAHAPARQVHVRGVVPRS